MRWVKVKLRPFLTRLHTHRDSTAMVSLDSRKFHLFPTATINIFDSGNAVDPPERVEINGGH